jgi:hypothetical protein
MVKSFLRHQRSALAGSLTTQLCRIQSMPPARFRIGTWSPPSVARPVMLAHAAPARTYRAAPDAS